MAGVHSPKPLGVDGFNRLTERQRMHLLYDVCSSPIWARRVLAGGPFRDPEALLRRADQVLAELPDVADVVLRMNESHEIESASVKTR